MAARRKYSVVSFPRTTNGNPFPFIKPVYRESRLDTANQIGVIAHGAFDIVDVGSLLALQEQLNRTAVPAPDKQLTVAALDSILPVVYGRNKVAGLLANAVTYNNYWHFWTLWCLGEIDAIEQVYINDSPPGFGNIQSTLGSFSQPLMGSLYLPMTVWYQTNIANNGTVFDQTCPGIAYSDVIAPVGDIQQPPQINAILRGRKVYDPRTLQDPDDESTWTYSRNAALVLADFCRSTRYGAGYTVEDWTSVIAAANDCDSAGRIVNFVIDKRTKISDWIATLQQAANCWIAMSGNNIKLKPDNLTVPVATFDHDDGTILGVDNEEGETQGNLPTVMEIIYTDTSQVQWQDTSAPLIKDPGVDDLSKPWIKSQVRMPWIQDEAEATKEGYLRYNKLHCRLPKMSILVMDEGLELEVGDAINLTYLDSGYCQLLPVKISSIAPNEQGWVLGVFYDDPQAYLNDRIAAPSIATCQPDPMLVPPIRGLVLSEVVGHPQILATWDPPIAQRPPQLTVGNEQIVYPYVKDYLVEITQGSTPVEDGKTIVRRYQSTDKTTGLLYTVCVTVRNTFGLLSDPVCGQILVGSAIRAYYKFTTPDLVNMKEIYSFKTGKPYWVTSMGDIWNTTFPSLFNTYTNPIYSYHTPGRSTLTTEEFDTGADWNPAQWDGETDTVSINGSFTRYIELSVGNQPLVRHATNSYNGEGQNVRLSSETLGTATQRVNDLGDITVTS